MPDRDDWATFVGIEVEGRFSGIPTVYVADEPFSVNSTRGYPHVWFQPGYLMQYGFDKVYAAQRQERVITLEVTKDLLAEVPEDLLESCHICLSIHVGEIFEKLKPLDTVRLDFSYQHVASVMKQSFIVSTPEQYKSDKVLTWKKGVTSRPSRWSPWSRPPY